MKKNKPHLLYVVTVDWYFCSHRFELALAAQKSGYQVSVATNINKFSDKIKKARFGMYKVPFLRSMRKPLKDLMAIFVLFKIYYFKSPDVIHHISLKPILFGTLIARLCGCKNIVNTFTGLGYLYTDDLSERVPMLRKVIRLILRWSFASNKVHAVVQNQDDMNVLLNEKILKKEQLTLIRGSGVDTDIFDETEELDDRTIKIIFASRLLKDKGIYEFIDAAKLLLKKDINAEFLLAGSLDKDNLSAIDESTVKKWEQEGIVKWIGYQADMSKIFKGVNIVCLPSYREGLPRTLLEAAASGRAIVTTDVPGCREVVQDGVNGFLVPVKDSVKLADALEKLINNKGLRKKMGQAGRAIVEDNFSNDIVIKQWLELYGQLMTTRSTF